VTLMQKTQFTPLLLLLALVCFQAVAQEEDSAAAQGPVIPADEFDRGTPRRTADGFLAAVDRSDYETAAEYLDLRNLLGVAEELTGTELARRLSVIVNRATWIDIDELVDDPGGRGNDGLPGYRDSIGVVLNKGKEVRLLMQKVPRGDGVSIWKVSNATVSIIPELYEIYGYPEVVERLARHMPTGAIFGYEYFKWVLVLAAGSVGYGLVFLLALVVRRALGDPDRPSNRRVFRFIVIPFGIWVVIVSLNAVAITLGRGVTAEALQRVSPIPVLITTWMLFGGINLIREVYANRLNALGRPGVAGLLRPASNAIKLLVGIAALLVYLDKLGFNITTVLAGLGVGGIAVALALQKPMEDVFGAFTLYAQQPVRIGDFCRVGNETGTIEEIGLRTTRLRTLADTVIAIPNAQLASQPIDNISARQKIRYRSILRLRYDSEPEQIEQVLEGVRELLSAHERVLPDGHRVRFYEIADDALLVEVNAYLNTTEWAEYLRLAEELNMLILQVVAAAGTSLSLPARTLHVKQELPAPAK
jgi:MscS family membrane protein